MEANETGDLADRLHELPARNTAFFVRKLVELSMLGRGDLGGAGGGLGVSLVYEMMNRYLPFIRDGRPPVGNPHAANTVAAKGGPTPEWARELATNLHDICEWLVHAGERPRGLISARDRTLHFLLYLMALPGESGRVPLAEIRKALDLAEKSTSLREAGISKGTSAAATPPQGKPLTILVDTNTDPSLLANFLVALSAVYTTISDGDELVIQDGMMPAQVEELV